MFSAATWQPFNRNQSARFTALPAAEDSMNCTSTKSAGAARPYRPVLDPLNRTAARVFPQRPQRPRSALVLVNCPAGGGREEEPVGQVLSGTLRSEISGARSSMCSAPLAPYTGGVGVQFAGRLLTAPTRRLWRLLDADPDADAASFPGGETEVACLAGRFGDACVRCCL